MLTEAMIIAMAKAAEAWALVLVSPEGQELMKQAREDNKAFRETWGQLWAALPTIRR